MAEYRIAQLYMIQVGTVSVCTGVHDFERRLLVALGQAAGHDSELEPGFSL